MTDDPGGPLDVHSLAVIGRRATTHPLVEGWAFRPDELSPRRLEVRLDDGQYPASVTAVRLDVRWFEGDDYAIHYVESRGDDLWQCRWDRHPKPGGPETHLHPPPNASADVEPSPVDDTHSLGALFAVLEWIEARLETLHAE